MPRRWITRILRIFEGAENAIHVLVAVLLTGLALALLGDTVADVVRTLRGQRPALPVVLNILDQTLVLFIVAELLHTVRITIQHRGRLNAEPFLGRRPALSVLILRRSTGGSNSSTTS